MNNMLTLDEVRKYLEVEQQELERLIKNGLLHAYKVGGVYLRFRKEEVLNLKYDVLLKKKKNSSVSFWHRVLDFWRFNNFYIVSAIVIVLLVYWFLHTQQQAAQLQ